MPFAICLGNCLTVCPFLTEYCSGTITAICMMPRVLIAGAGATGALCAHILRRDLQHKVELVVWEKSRGAGGRMSTSRNQDNAHCTADLGAQYITVTPQYAEKHKIYHEELISNGILRPLTGTIQGAKEDEKGTRHFVTPDGISSVVKHFLKKSGARVEYEHHLSKLETYDEQGPTQPESQSGRLDSQSGTTVHPAGKGASIKTKIIASTQEGGAGNQPEVFDAVILTMPVAQILQQRGIVQESLEKNSSVKSLLESVRYSSRYALGLFFDPGTNLEIPWCASYVQGDPCIRWISADAEKRGVDSAKLGPSIAVHTSVPFGIKYLETDKEEVEPIIMQHLRQLLPTLPEPARVKCQRWRYSQVFTPYEGSPGCVFLARLPTYAVVASGDAFTHSNLDGCISSAEATCQRLVEYFIETDQLQAKM